MIPNDEAYQIRLRALQARLDEFERAREIPWEEKEQIAKRLIEYAKNGDEVRFKKELKELNPLLLREIFEYILFNTTQDEQSWIFARLGKHADFFISLWINLFFDHVKLVNEFAGMDLYIPDNLIKKLNEKIDELSPLALSKIVTRLDPALIEKVLPHFSTENKAVIVDKTDIDITQALFKEEVVDVVEALIKMNSEKAVCFIASLPLPLFKELKDLKTPLNRILGSCLNIPYLLRLTRMGEEREHYLLRSIPYSDNRKPFLALLDQAYIDGMTGKGSYIKNFPPILFILCLNHNNDIEHLLPFMTKDHNDLYAQIPFIAAFANRAPLLKLFKEIKKGEPTILYAFLRSLAIAKIENEDRLTLEDVAIEVNRKATKYIQSLSTYGAQFRQRDKKAFYSQEEINSLEAYIYIIEAAASLNFDAQLAPFCRFHAQHLIIDNIYEIDKLCEEGRKLIPALMQYEDKQAKGVIFKGPRGRSQNRVPIIWKAEVRRQKSEVRIAT